MWNKTLSVESLQLGAIITFIKFMQSQSPDILTDEKIEATLVDDVAALREMLPLDDVAMIVRDMSCDRIDSEDGKETLFAVELSSPEELDAKLKSIVSELVTRLISNMMAFGAKKELVDVAFDDNDGFVFSLTNKAKTLCQEYLARDKKDGENADG